MAQGDQVRLPALVMLETWLREGRVRLLVLVILETWVQDRGSPPDYRLSCSKHGCKKLF